VRKGVHFEDRAGRIRGLAVEERGESLVMLALTLPILLGFTFGLMQLCLVYYSWNMISESARQGARYAIVHGATCETSAGASCTASAATVQSYVEGLGWANLGGGTMSVAATYPDGDEAPGHRVLVTVTYSFPYNIKFVTSRSISLSSSSEMYILQ
jgi:Flp pilus assembly protein TadG